jgi:hypothetical protein
VETVEEEEKIQSENNRRKYRKRGVRPIIIGVLLASGLGFLWAEYVVSIIAGVRLMNLSEQPYNPSNQKIPDAVQGALLIAFSTIAVVLLTLGIIWLLIAWKRKFKRKRG